MATRERKANMAFMEIREDGDSLKLLQDPDTVTANKLIRDAENESLLILFTGWAISEKTLLDDVFVKNEQIQKILKNYKILVFHVDDRSKIDSSVINTIGLRNSTYQRDIFQSVIQPHYIIFHKGVKICERHYIPNPKTMIAFVENCK